MSTDLAAVTTDLALLGTIEEIALLPADQQPAYITGALAESRKWLHLATEATNPRPFAELKAWAASLTEYARQKGLASEIVADGQEMLRRAERAVGQAVRNGQEAGSVTTRADGPVARDLGRQTTKISPSQVYGNHDEWVAANIVAGAPEEHFEAALTEARAEGNLSRNAETPTFRRRATRDPRPLTCPTGKLTYATEHDAQVELVGTLVARNRGKGRRKESRTYACKLCGGWHLTSRPLRAGGEA